MQHVLVIRSFCVYEQRSYTVKTRRYTRQLQLPSFPNATHHVSLVNTKICAQKYILRFHIHMQYLTAAKEWRQRKCKIPNHH